jgi:hypothetical protein
MIEQVRIGNRNILPPVVLKITLPADGSWMEAIDVFGFNKLVPMAKEVGGDPYMSIDWQTSADGLVWASYEETQPFEIALADNWHTGATSMSVLRVGGGDGFDLITAPYIRFRATDAPSRGKSFYLYCL